MQTKAKNIAKKIASLLLLGVSLLFLETGLRSTLLAYYVASTSSVKLNLPALLFRGNSPDMLIGIIVLILASFSWDWKVNRKIFGIFLCVAGFDFVLQAFGVLSNPPFKDYEPFDKISPTSIFVGFLGSAILFIVIGIFILKRNKRNDKVRNTLKQA